MAVTSVSHVGLFTMVRRGEPTGSASASVCSASFVSTVRRSLPRLSSDSSEDEARLRWPINISLFSSSVLRDVFDTFLLYSRRH